MKLLNTVVITLAGLGFVGFGLSCIFWPQAVLSGIGILIDSPEAQVEISAMYGGLELGLGILLLNCFAAERQRFGILLSFSSYGGLATIRLLMMLVHGVSSSFLIVAFIWEALIAGLALLALRNKAS
jgi:Domain of unknown function (DUF4345)